VDEFSSFSTRKTRFLTQKQTLCKTLGKVKRIGLFWGSKKHMTKLFAIAFTCVYLTLTVGVVRTTHYCMGRVKSSAFFSFDTQKCACALFAKPTSKSCCNDEHTLIAIEDDHSASTSLSVTPEFFAISDLGYSQPNDEVDHSPGATSVEDSPPMPDIPLFLRHCSLILFDEESIA
jgi:hypothetical protein